MQLASYLVLTQSAEAVGEAERDRPETLLYHGVPPPPDTAEDAGFDPEFIEVFERVCDTGVIVSKREVLRIPLDFDEAVKALLTS